MKRRLFLMSSFQVFLTISVLCIESIPETYNNLLKKLNHPEKLIFDITAELGKDGTGKLTKELSQTIYTDVLPGNDTNGKCFKNRTNEEENIFCSYVYNKELYPEQNSIKILKKVVNESQNEFPLTIDSLENYLNNHINESDPETITIIFKENIWNLRSATSSINETIRIISKFKLKWGKVRSINVGMEWDDVYRWEMYYLHFSTMVDLIILNVNIYYNQFGLTFSHFNSTLFNHIARREAFIRKQNSECEILLKINLPEGSYGNYKTDPNGLGELYQKYFYFLLQYSISIINSGESRKIILQYFDKNEGEFELFANSSLRRIVTPNIDSHNSLVESNSSCPIKRLLNKVSSTFDTVLIESSTFLAKTDDLKRSQHCQISYPNELPQFYLNHEFAFDEDPSKLIPKLSSRFEDFKTKLEHLPWKHLLLFPRDFDEEEVIEDSLFKTHNNHSTNTELKYFDFLPNITFACNFVSYSIAWSPATEHKYIIEAIRERCDFMWKETNVIMWNLAFNTEESKDHVLEALIRNRILQKSFLAQYPDKQVMLWVDMLLSRKYRVEMNNLYCDEEILEFNERAEIIVNFARIHGYPVGFKQVLTDANDGIGWWTVLRTLEKITASETYPAFVARNYPKYQAIGHFPTDPCISWTEDIPNQGIPLDLEYSGTSFYLEKIKLNGLDTTFTLKEFQIMLMLTIHKFTLIELLPSSVEDLELVMAAFSQRNFIELLGKYEKHLEKSEIYLALELSEFKEILEKEGLQFLEKMFYYFSKLPLKLTGIHFKNWEQYLPISSSHFLNKHGIKMGWNLENCVEHVNGLFQRLQNAPGLHPQLDYILCSLPEVREVSNHNQLEMERLLDTSLYIRKLYAQMFPNSSNEILFRLNLVKHKFVDDAVTKGNVKNALKFLNDVNQYSRLNKIKFFMLPAFDNEAGSRFGWWQILNFGTLTNTSVFIEKESDYLKKETWRPPQELLLQLSPLSSALLVAGMGVVNFALGGFVLLLLLVWYHKRRNFLTDEDVREFEEGKSENNFVEGEVFQNLKFREEFEIKKNKIIMLNIIGAGHFGLVYKAELSIEKSNQEERNSERSVAVKIPKPDRTKETFKTMLSELKTFSHIGEHPHVLRFIGAHTKAIRRGEVYIVMELCENGALRDYLQILQTKFQPQQEQKKSPIFPFSYELYRFSQEIASGMAFISNKNLVHGDLSSRNVLLDAHMCCKIGDFGLSRKLYGCKVYKRTEIDDLPWRWMALETLRNQEFTRKSDIWSFGITLWEIFSLGNIPFPTSEWNDEFIESLEKGERPPCPKYASELVYDKMFSCWMSIPDQRPSFLQLCDYFSSLKKSEYSKLAKV